VDKVMNLRVHKMLRFFLRNCITGGFSRRAQLHGDSEYRRIPLEIPCILQSSHLNKLGWTTAAMGTYGFEV
jgi:hypothetical protein